MLHINNHSRSIQQLILLAIQHPLQARHKSLPEVLRSSLNGKRPVIMRHALYDFPLHLQTRIFHLSLKHPAIVAHAVFLTVEDPSRWEVFDSIDAHAYGEPVLGLVVVRRVAAEEVIDAI